MYVIYGKDNCPQCNRAKDLLEHYRLDYEYLTMGREYTREDLVALAPEARSVPQVWVVDGGIRHVGGYQELEKHVARDQIRESFKTFDRVKVVFTKVDGTERTMVCTLQPDLLPESTSTNEHKSNPDVLAVYDLDNEGWRSFRLDSVISCQAA